MKAQILTALAAAAMLFAAAPGQAQERHADRHGGRHGHHHGDRQGETIIKLKCDGNDCRLVFGGHKRQQHRAHHAKPWKHRVYGHHWRKRQAWKRRQARKAHRRHHRHDRLWHRRHDGRHGRHGRHHDQSRHRSHNYHG